MLKLIYVFNFSDTMGNLGAFITLNGDDMIPLFTTYEAVVSTYINFRSLETIIETTN